MNFPTLTYELNNFRSKSQTHTEKEAEIPLVELPAEEPQDPLSWKPPADPDLLADIREVHEKIAPLPSVEDQIIELARCDNFITKRYVLPFKSELYKYLEQESSRAYY